MTSSHFFAWLLTAGGLSAFALAFTSFVSRFLIVNFAVEERIPAGLAIFQALRRAAGNPGDFICAWLLATGIQWAAVILPVATLLGMFLIPSTLFLAEILGASLAAQVWGGSGQGE